MKKQEKNNRKKRILVLTAVLLLSFSLLTSCGTSSEDAAKDDQELTSEVDYSLEENWAYYASAEGETEADVFFVCPTVYSGRGTAYDFPKCPL